MDLETVKKKLILPNTVFGIRNIGNTCFFNSTM
jgi:ubiquitin C-terminal hydrolase